MSDSIIDPETREEIRKLSKKKIGDMLKNPDDIGSIIDEFYPEMFKLCGIDMDNFGELFKDVENEKKKAIVDSIFNLRMIFLMQVEKKVDDNISDSIGLLFDICENKDRDALKKIFEKPRMELFRKLLSSFKKSWRLIDEKDLVGEPILDNRVRMIKAFSEGIYKELLIVIQEMVQIAYDYKKVTGFGLILDQLENVPDHMDILVNRAVYDIRNSESHENVEYDRGQKALFYDQNGKLIREMTIEELDKNFRWLTDFVKSSFYKLQEKYLDFIGINHNQEARIEYMINVLFPAIIGNFIDME